ELHSLRRAGHQPAAAHRWRLRQPGQLARHPRGAPGFLRADADRRPVPATLAGRPPAAAQRGRDLPVGDGVGLALGARPRRGRGSDPGRAEDLRRPHRVDVHGGRVDLLGGLTRAPARDRLPIRAKVRARMEESMNPILEPAGEALRVDVISDVVCPWCYVGKRQLEDALARWREAHPDSPAPRVRWHPFQLNPDMPEEGIARADYLARKFGSPDPGAIYQRVGAAARAVGLEPDFAKIARQPNTLRAHALVGAARDEAQQQAIVERLFRAYF